MPPKTTPQPSWKAGVNPFRRYQTGHADAEPCSIVIFGASGDLTQRKLVPALFNLVVEEALTTPFSIIGFARREDDDDDFRKRLHQALDDHSRSLPERFAGLNDFLRRISYQRGSFDRPEDFTALKDHLSDIEKKRGGPRNRLYYLATPPESFTEIIRNLKAAGLTGNGLNPEGWTRIIIEKPY